MGFIPCCCNKDSSQSSVFDLIPPNDPPHWSKQPVTSDLWSRWRRHRDSSCAPFTPVSVSMLTAVWLSCLYYGSYSGCAHVLLTRTLPANVTRHTYTRWCEAAERLHQCGSVTVVLYGHPDGSPGVDDQDPPLGGVCRHRLQGLQRAAARQLSPPACQQLSAASGRTVTQFPQVQFSMR